MFYQFVHKPDIGDLNKILQSEYLFLTQLAPVARHHLLRFVGFLFTSDNDSYAFFYIFSVTCTVSRHEKPNKCTGEKYNNYKYSKQSENCLLFSFIQSFHYSIHLSKWLSVNFKTDSHCSLKLLLFYFSRTNSTNYANDAYSDHN